MAFAKFANAKVAKASIAVDDWNQIRVSSQKSGVKLSSENQIKDYSPDKYLLTHCTIIASVDVEENPKNAKGWGYIITEATEQFVNSNQDSWERDLLLATYRTFIGGENYVEHIQIPELSKGKLIDAVARDVGDSVYVDILVATDRKHEELIRDIEESKVTTLSMGCFLPGTQVSMADGRRLAIEDVAPGDMVLTHLGRARKVQNKQVRMGTWSVRIIDAVGLPAKIRATDIHPFFVYRAPTVCACGCGEDLPSFSGTSKASSRVRGMARRFKRGHDKRILNPNAVYSLEDRASRVDRLVKAQERRMEEVQASDLRVGDHVCFPRALFDGRVESVTIGKARLLGYFLAEGSFWRTNGELVGVEFNFSLSEKDTYVAEVVDLLKKEFALTNDPWLQDRVDRNTCTVHLTSSKVADWFFRLGGEYSHSKVLHEDVLHWPEDAQKHLLGTWINGDGNLHSLGSTSVTTVSYDLACQMHLILARCGLWARMESHVGAKSVDLQEIVGSGFARDAESGRLPSYTLVIGQTSAGLLGGCTDKILPGAWKTQANRILDDVVMFPITSIETTTYTGEVHDMQVNEDHSYVVEGVAVHNCSVEYTICSKCGNVSADDTQLCQCIKYSKGNHFFDKKGKRRKIAELCGHKSDAKSVKFIEASWVANPAFKGAVLRSFVQSEEVKEAAIRAAFEIIRADSPDSIQKAASLLRSAAGFDFDAPEEDGGGEEAAPEPAAPAAGPDPIKGLTDDLKTYIRNKVKKELQDEMKGPTPSDTRTEDSNENLVRSTFAFDSFKRKYAGHGSDLGLYRLYEGLVSIRTAGWKSLHVKGYTGREVLALSYFVDKNTDTPDPLDKRAYDAIATVGGVGKFDGPVPYLTACARAMGIKKVSRELATALIRKGRLYSYGVGK